MDEIITQTMEALRKNNMTPYYAEHAADVPGFIEKMIPPGSVVRTGGSVSLEQSGALRLLSNGKYQYLPHLAVSHCEREHTHRDVDAFSCDWYLTSSNAVTMHGELYNVDGGGNRVAAMAFGSRRVLVIIGRNKLVPNLEAAIYRVKTVSAPQNAVRKGHKTYCSQAGHCIAIDRGWDSMTAGCSSPFRICSSFSVLAHQHEKFKDRIHVLIVNESLGF